MVSSKKTVLGAFMAAAMFLGVNMPVQACVGYCPPAADLGSSSAVKGWSAAGPNQVSFSVAHSENQGFAATSRDFALSTNKSSGYAMQSGGSAEFTASGYAGAEKACYGCFDRTVGAGTNSQVGGAAFQGFPAVVAGAGAISYAGLDYTSNSVSTYADGLSGSGVVGNGAANSGYWSYAGVNND
jgi:hypothetical protein